MLPKVVRHSDWPTRLQNFLIDRDQLPFKWSTNDCATFSCDAILAMTGVDLAVHYRDSYSTQLGSIRAIRRLTGGHAVEDAAAHSAAEHGLDEINPVSAKRGDWVLLHNQAHKILGVVALDGKNAVAVSEAGVIFLPLTCAVRAWRI